jgi:hypothetical protein
MIRGGDVFQNPRLNAGQPPCYFFTAVMAQLARTILITMGGNPCHDEMIRLGAEWWQGDIWHDQAVMIWARNFVLTRSSFALMPLYLSPFKKNLWTFADDTMWAQFGDLGEFVPHQRCDPREEYKRLVLFSWRASKEQIEMIHNETCTFREVWS